MFGDVCTCYTYWTIRWNLRHRYVVFGHCTQSDKPLHLQRPVYSLYIVGQTLTFAASGIFTVHSRTNPYICSVRYIQSLYIVGQTLTLAVSGIFSHCIESDKPLHLQCPVYSVTVHSRKNPDICSVRYIRHCT